MSNTPRQLDVKALDRLNPTKGNAIEFTFAEAKIESYQTGTIYKPKFDTKAMNVYMSSGFNDNKASVYMLCEDERITKLPEGTKVRIYGAKNKIRCYASTRGNGFDLKLADDARIEVQERKQYNGNGRGGYGGGGGEGQSIGNAKSCAAQILSAAVTAAMAKGDMKFGEAVRMAEESFPGLASAIYSWKPEGSSDNGSSSNGSGDDDNGDSNGNSNERPALPFGDNTNGETANDLPF